MQKNFQVGEILVQGPARSCGAKTFILTSPMLNGGAKAEVLFGIMAAEAPRKVVERLTERLAEALRASFFDASGSLDQRYEAALKQANKTILAFLHEHRLSLPGIKLRGVVGTLSDDTLLISNRGTMRGIVLVPRNGRMNSLSLFKEGSDTQTNPKFFSSFQSGSLLPGSMIIAATKELFQVLDETYLKRLFSEKDSVDASRDIRMMLKGKSQAVSLTLTTAPKEADETVAETEPAPVAPKRTPAKPRIPVPRAHRAVVARKREKQPPLPVNMDIGEIGAKSIEGLLLFIWSYVKIIPLALWAGLKGLGTVMKVLFRSLRAAGALTSANGRRQVASQLKALPKETASRGLNRFNALPTRSKAHLLLLLIVSAVFVHGILFSVQRHSVAMAAKAYEAKLAEIEQLQTDLDTSLIIGNDRRSHDILSRLEGLVAVLPEETDNELRAKDELRGMIDVKRDTLRRIVTVAQPEVLATFEDPTGEFTGGLLTWFDKSLYLFSRTTSSVKTVALDGSVADTAFDGPLGGVRDITPGRTGLLLASQEGEIHYWNPAETETSAYPDYNAGASPVLFYEGRLYTARPDGMMLRRSILSERFGAEYEVLQSPSDLQDITGLAADGAAYLLSRDGQLRKYMKGLPVGEFKPPVIDPAPTQAADLWADPNSEWLVFIDRNSDRIFMIDSETGKLAAQVTSPEFGKISSASVDPRGQYVYLLSGNRVLSIPLKPPALK